MDTMNQKTSANLPDPSDTLLDDAAIEALGAYSPEASAAFTQRLAHASLAERQAAQQLKETVARMATASPFMEPPSDLRGKILQATAPKQFKIEDYRKRGEMAPVWQRWGLVAAVLFLTASAYYTSTLQTKLGQANTNLAIAQHRADTLKGNLAQAQGVVNGFVEKKIVQIPVVDSKNNLVGVLLQNRQTNQLTLVMPGTDMPENVVAHVILNKDGNSTTLVAGTVGKTPDFPVTPNAAQLDTKSPVRITTEQNGVKTEYAGQQLH